ncbi:unnamed protein product [Ectocarpus sp. CCAP 1310/34]|nr:unnamed protein product [Ectocarpus sp. CCAP 1310/34]
MAHQSNGNIWKGDLETGQGEVFELGAPGPAVGLDHDRRSGYLFVAGGPVGTARVYDEDFALVADLVLSDGNSSFVNDVIITKTAAYFTDSFQPKIYKARQLRPSLNEFRPREWGHSMSSRQHPVLQFEQVSTVSIEEKNVNLDRETGALVDGLAVHTLVLSDNVPVLEGAFNVNGIEVSDMSERAQPKSVRTIPQ